MKRSVCHVIGNHLGGITSVVQNLVNYAGSEALEQELLAINVKGDNKTKAFLDEDSNVFDFNPKSNWHHSFKRLSKDLSKNEGVLVSNDQYDLIMLQAFQIPRKIIQIVHDDYNATLSEKFEPVIDAFICHSKYIYNKIRKKLPDRHNSIYFIPYGIPLKEVPNRTLKPEEDLNLVFLGRHCKEKGVLDLIAIENNLRNRGVHVNWTILGSGPETSNVRKQWKDKTNVLFNVPKSNDEVQRILVEQDIFVFPTKFEGYPVSLIETMSVGCLPVVSDIPSGIPELVINGKTGILCGKDDINAFADAIAKLEISRGELCRMQLAAFDFSRKKHDVTIQTPIYQSLFRELGEDNKQPRHINIRSKIGSRLDHKAVPNFVTLLIRSINGKD